MKGLGNAEILAKNLRKYIESSGKLGKDIAAAVGVAPATFSEWVNGKKYPRIDKIEMLANYFHIQKSDLIEEKDHDASTGPITKEAKILSHGIDSMPLAERERAVEMFKLMFAQYAQNFEEGNDDDET